MSSPPERVLFAVNLERPVQTLIEDSFLSFAGTTRPSTGYHISIVGPAVMTDIRGFTRALEPVEAFLSTLSPILTTLCSVGVFQNGDIGTPYLNIQNPEPYIALHNKLRAILANTIEPENEQFRIWTVDNYAPHVTLGLGLSPGETKELARQTESMDLDISFSARTVTLLRQSSGSTWGVAQEFMLRKRDGES